MEISLEHLVRLISATMGDLQRLSWLLDGAMQTSERVVFELTVGSVIVSLNDAAAEVIGVKPRRAAGTRFTNYVADRLRTQQRLDTLSQQTQVQCWSDAWRRGPGDAPQPCELNGFALPNAVAGEHPRLLVWTDVPDRIDEDPAVATEEPRPTGRLLKPDQPVMTHDLEPLRHAFGIPIHRLCEVVGIATSNIYTWFRDSDRPIFNRTTVLHLRLLDAIPELAHMGLHPVDLKAALLAQRGIDLSFAELARLLGVDRRVGYGWERGAPATEIVRALTASLFYLLFNKPRSAWDLYLKLLDDQIKLEERMKEYAQAQADSDLSDAPSEFPPLPRGRGRPKKK